MNAVLSFVRVMVVSVFCLAAFTPAHAADPDPQAVLNEAAAALHAHNTFRFIAAVAYRGKFQGSEEQLDTDFTIVFQRPDNVALHVANADQEMFVYSDGKEFTHYIPFYNQYRIAELATMTTQDLVIMSGTDVTAPVLRAIASLTRDEPFSTPFAPEALQYIAADTVNGRACDRIRFAAFGRTYDLWIETAPERLIRKIETDMTHEEEDYAARYGFPFDFEVIATIDTWELGGDVTQQLAFTAPEGVEKVDAFMPPRQPFPSEALKGKAAPDFTLPLLTGGELTLAKEQGNVVVLDFWATWCVPCRIGLPVMKQIAAEYADKKVKIYTINKGDDAETIKGFLTQMGLEGLAVALDIDSALDAAYLTDSIPQTFIVGPNGVIESVHIGIPVDRAAMANVTSQEEAESIQRDGYAKILREEIDALLAAGEASVNK